MTGGAFRTNSTAAAGSSVVTVTGDFNATGLDDTIAVTAGGGDGIGVNSNSTLFIGGVLRLNGYSRATLGASAANLIINGGLEMTGNTLQQSNGAGANITRLNGDVTTFASTNVARLGNSTDSDTFTELTGTRTFTVADGPAGLDLSLSSVVRDSPSPIATGGLIKTGPGTMQIEGGGTGNSYTGPTTINEGTVILFKSAGVAAIPGGPLTIGDGVGGARADRVILRNSNQIADANQVTISASGLLDLETFNTSESIASLAGSGNVDLGANSTLTVNGANNTTYAGEIYGPGAFVKAGSGVLELKGTSEIAAGTTISGGALIVNGSVTGSAVTNAGAVLGGDGSIIGPVVIDTGGTVSPGNGPGSLDTGDLLLNGTLAAEVFSTSSYDSLNVTGSVTLAGPLSLTIGSGPFSGIFKLIVNDDTDPVIGTFAGLPEGSLAGTNGSTEFYISYVGNVDGGDIGNDVVLFIPEPGSLALLLGGIGFLAGRRQRRSN
jgi:autotransporter-associated beta strand protein